MTQKLPVARSESVVMQQLEKETLLFDFEINKAYCLNETSSNIYHYCDGKTSFEELKRRYKYTDDLIYLALDELQKNNLIKGDKITHFAGMSRRDAVRKVGLGTMLALPVITGLIAPRAASAGSCSANTQTDINNCGSCGNVCNSANAIVACNNGNCQIISCSPNFRDCNFDPSDGCETNILTSTTNCGACGLACNINNGTGACVAGSCTIASCNSGFDNCNGSVADGCETNLQTSNIHCGACNRPCPGGQSCQNGSCVAPRP